MTTRLTKHPTFALHSELTQITQPLQDYLDISYFCHTRITPEHEFSFIGSTPEIGEQYVDLQLYNQGVHQFNSPQLIEYVIHDDIEKTLKLSNTYQLFHSQHVDHLFTIVDRTQDDINYYHFGIDSSQYPLLTNTHYLQCLPMLHEFTKHFNSLVASNKRLSSAYNINWTLTNNSQSPTDTIPEAQFSEFLQALKNRNILTPRELEVLNFLRTERTFKSIASTLGITERTIKAHINNIKTKTGCDNLFQLGYFCSHLLTNKPD